jgi:hypothetical protein
MLRGSNKTMPDIELAQSEGRIDNHKKEVVGHIKYNGEFLLQKSLENISAGVQQSFTGRWHVHLCVSK